MRVVATAGHVDHGKSSLVLALTGTDPDRWPEEKTRGPTIDLGFAFTTLPSGQELGFVDVPGHVRFLKNMLAGVGAVEAAILVVAATEGWMPQSEEHLRILDLLGISHGLAVITKADLVDDDLLELARLEVEERLAQADSFTPTDVLAVDSRSGRGLDDLRVALDAMLASAPLAVDRGRPRLWVDRVFAAKGAGTIVTGTMAGGTLALDTEVVILPGRRRARVRHIESHHEELSEAGPGRRVALNLAGIDHTELARGSA
ncbi:MAG TPA: selenocysteine-specific translation elongation factor, partial [Acidimicrobiia bacterium]|nr:selenocysteine-specific translation elongation factor [Acidimicrobiia bacterium]